MYGFGAESASDKWLICKQWSTSNYKKEKPDKVWILNHCSWSLETSVTMSHFL
ncbi:hypothetical protein ZIOFF_056255 [Zingiber officinale]|uniref:Uncharacterized protein n=1 Tax=Zingiber officinale TaxID=94328 RepID=A0A8J5FDP5_ZINOF|nr:hypothetical protein ZIOFF_056255 [Zingiber officinale]